MNTADVEVLAACLSVLGIGHLKLLQADRTVAGDGFAHGLKALLEEGRPGAEQVFVRGELAVMRTNEEA